MGSTSLWVFGYGSLCWHPGFEYGDSVVGHINGFARKFWQGNTYHRGTPDKPGRVATLVEEHNSTTHGIAFQLLGDAALSYLNNREVTLGGYNSHITTFHPKEKDKPGFPVLLYVATPSNEHWLGPAPAHEIAEQVIGCRGEKGHNVEYVLRLADWIKNTIPEVHDEHLFGIETHIRLKIKERNMCYKTLMGERDGSPTRAAAHAAEGAAGGAEADMEAHENRAFSARVQNKKLRCVKI